MKRSRSLTMRTHVTATAHNPKVVGSNPAPATKEVGHLAKTLGAFLFARCPQGAMRWRNRL